MTAPIASHRHGSPGDPALILVHGFPLDGAMWAPLVPALVDAGWQALVPDLRGFGTSPAQPSAGIDEMADDVAALAKGLSIPTAVVVGFSMGGYVALSLAVRHPALVRGLVLAGTRAEADTAEARSARLALKDKVLKDGTAAAVEAMLPKQFTPRTQRERPRLVEEMRQAMLRQEPAGVAAALQGMADRPDRRGDLGRIGVPALVVVGADDAITPPASARGMADALRAAQFAELPGCAHMSPREDPDRFLGVLLPWLSRLR